ncbi:MAG: molybdate ABC transporter permease subunit [Pseudomonadota bacterium]
MDEAILAAVITTLRLAGTTTAILFVIGVPLAWWLAQHGSRGKLAIEAIVALPLVLPPTVLGFYLLIVLGPQGPLGDLWINWLGHPLAFTFSGLVIASCLYSLPFVVQPLQAAFESLDRHTLEAAWTLGASPWRAFWNIAVPQARRGFLIAAVLGFAHTVGEFGVVLMVGGNIAGETQVISIAIYEQVETLNYQAAHRLSAAMIVFSFIVLLAVYSWNRRQAGWWR